MKPKLYTLSAIVILVAGTAFALVHGIVGARYAGFNSQEYVGLFAGTSRVVDFLLAGLWAAGAFGLMLRKNPPAYVLAALGGLAMASHGLLYSLTTTSPLGLVFVLAAAVLGVSLKRSWSSSRSGATEVPRTSRLSWSH